MTDSRKKLGAFGEAYAQAHLSRLGYRVLQSNVRLSSGEIDIVARDGDTLVFVEVRTRRTDRFGTGEESITRSKARRLIDLADEYLQSIAPPPAAWRIDVVALDLARNGRVARVDVLRNAIEAPSP